MLVRDIISPKKRIFLKITSFLVVIFLIAQIFIGLKGSAAGFTPTQKTTVSPDKNNPQFQVVGDKIYYVWQQYDSTYYQIWTGEMNTDGTGWSATRRKSTSTVYQIAAPQLQVVGTKIYYVWQELDGTYYQIWTADMNTDGSGWSAIQRTTSTFDKQSPQFQVFGTKIYYVWSEQDGANYQIWTADMNTDGSGWNPIQETNSAFHKVNPQLQVVGTKIYYVWSEDDGRYQIWTADMNTDGSGWNPVKQTTSTSDKQYPQLQVVGTKIYYVWKENNNQIWTADMNTDGSGWAATQRTNNSDFKEAPQLQVDGSKIYYTWPETAGAYNQIWTAEMDTDGTDWHATQKTDSAYNKNYPQLQIVGSKIYYVWSGSDGIYYQIWTAGMNTDGTGWSAIQRTPSSYENSYAQLQVVGTKIYYVYLKSDFTTIAQIWTAEMNTDGSSWVETQRTNNNYQKGPPQFQVVGNKIYYVWDEWDTSIYYQIWTAEMNTDGTGWSATKRTTSTYAKEQPQLQVMEADNKIYYTWIECDGTSTSCTGQYYQIWTAEMNLDGSGWNAVQQTASAFYKYYPQLQVVGTKIYYIWSEQDGANYQLWTAEMNTDGSGWNAVQQTSSAFDKWGLQFQVDGTKIYYVWQEVDGVGDTQLWTAEMNTDGTGWVETQRTTSAFYKSTPQLQVDGTKIYYVWTGSDGTYFQIWTAEMNTDGSGWLETQRTLSSFSKERIQFQAVGTNIYYVWKEIDSAGYYQIWTGEMTIDGSIFTAIKRTDSTYQKDEPQLQVVEADNKIYYVWRECNNTSTACTSGYYQIWTAEINMDGSGWSATQRTTSTNQKSSPQLQVAGTVIYYVWSQCSGTSTTCAAQYYHVHTAHMNTDGSGWGGEANRTTTSNNNYEPQLQVDGTRIYYAWNRLVGSYRQIMTGEMNTDDSGWTNSQRTSSNYSKYEPQLQRVDSMIYYVWRECTTTSVSCSTAYWQIWTATWDGGTFTATRRTTSTYTKYEPQLQVDGTKIHYVWRECDATTPSCGGGYYQIWTAEMNTNGSGWTETKRTSSAIFKKERPQLQVVDDKIYYLWQEVDVDPRYQLWTAEINIDGSGWITTQKTTSDVPQYSPKLQFVGTKIYYVGSEYDPAVGIQIFTGEMNINGTGWTTTKQTISAFDKVYPQLQVTGSKIYYVWDEWDGTGYYQIWTAEMNTDGTGWTATQRTTSAFDKQLPQLQVSGTKIYYIWLEYDITSNYQIWTAEMNTDGTGWNAVQQTNTAFNKTQPQLQVVGDKIYYVWTEDDGTGNYQIWTAEMNTDGTGWNPVQQTTSPFGKGQPQLQVIGPKIYYIWTESDGAYNQIWTAQMNTDGSGWSAIQRTSSAFDKQYPQLQVVGDKIYYVWSESDGAIYQIWTGEMNIGGGGGWIATQRTNSTDYSQQEPQFQVTGSRIHYVWFDTLGQIWTADMGLDFVGERPPSQPPEEVPPTPPEEIPPIGEITFEGILKQMIQILNKIIQLYNQLIELLSV